MRYHTLFSLLCLLFYLNGCTTIIDATTSEPISIDPTKRPFGTYINDKRLQVIIGVNLRKASPELKQSNITITSFNGVVLLTGQVPTNALRTLAGKTATAVNSVRQVHNELQVKGNIAFLAKANDSWLSTKVNTILLANPDIKSSRVKNIVEDGTVYLMGLVTQTQADNIARIASNTGGVKEVVKVFEYID